MYKRQDVNKGTWKFKEYDKKDVTIDNKDEHVVGTWVFEDVYKRQA